MKTDAELLREYARRGDEAAFAEVVRRHVDFVYSAALRLLQGETAAAQDVAQMVFADLARKAARLAQRPTLAGWLHTSARYAAVTHIRRERRRRAREQEAATMPALAADPAVDWDQIRPLLDDAVGRLGERDREAVLLRYFHNRSHREVGAALGLGEDAARKVVERALEKLRGQFARRGVAAGAALLATALPAHAVQPAPAAWSASAAGAALATPAAGAGAALFTFLTMNAKLTITAIAGFVLITAACPFLLRQSSGAEGGAGPLGLFDSSDSATSLPDVTAPASATLPALPGAGSPSLAEKLDPTPAAAVNSSGSLSPADREAAARRTQLLSGRVDGLGVSELAAASPSSPLEQKLLELIGQNPPATRPYDLEIFALDPGTTSSYRIRADVEQISLRAPLPGFPREMPRGAAYYLPAANRFYIQWDAPGSSTLHYHGPFQGDPRVVLGLPPE